METNFSHLKENSDLKMVAREQLRGKWGAAILLCVIFSVITGLTGIPYIGPVLSLLLMDPLTLGMASCFIKLVRNNHFDFEDLFDGFSNFASALILQLLISLFVFLWSLLLLIPGIIAAYRYSMAFFILNDNPKLGAMEAIKASKSMMNGYKLKLFSLHLSFIGWSILSILTFGIGLLWLIPYINASVANFYENLKSVV